MGEVISIGDKQIYVELITAYNYWKSLQPPRDESCCSSAHQYIDGQGFIKERPEYLKCERERAWIKYCDLRDAYYYKN